MPESNVHLSMSHTNPNAGPSIEDASRHNGTASNILKSGKLRSLFQWSSRATRAPPRSPGPPAPGSGSPAKGKPEDDSRAGGTNSRRDSSSSSSSSDSSSSRGSHSSGRSHHSDDHDHGVDWDW
ncbi:hypothetical protein AGABI1DRAFT_128988 [Agaricus bisporus var. burnettii JB137-S8]|uniref:Uncharacterized protein n=1 Tax=Agaricus bisporus var. burnettii (strain JB137-S8 / ATCC MYA-4627 / FGSC 10392) TaxID=597362 RepID=K5X697_AGABU|nr:uncharacterized protein AGABI1DRAFT_128988 [Agaricus bisporus var. burnettii JB137-S8]EKM78703.1 hypothetical protein AGABI1DRAFT_128988 [Agaricus bisporus var. burnettii JB137-S8]